MELYHLYIYVSMKYADILRNVVSQHCLHIVKCNRNIALFPLQQLSNLTLPFKTLGLVGLFIFLFLHFEFECFLIVSLFKDDFTLTKNPLFDQNTVKSGIL